MSLEKHNNDRLNQKSNASSSAERVSRSGKINFPDLGGNTDQIHGLNQLANESSQVYKTLQLKRISKENQKNRNQIVQLKKSDKIVENKFNVIGETHTEDEIRIRTEKRISESLTAKDAYWLEGEFIMTHVFAPNEPGDDKSLRAKQSILRIHQVWQQIIQIGKQNILLRFQNSRNLFQEMYTHALLAYGEADYSCWNTAEVKDLKQPLLLFAHLVRSMIQNPKDETYEQIVAKIAALNVTGNWANVSQSRSNHMHKMANKAAQSNTKGVWKIGEKHVQDIIKDYKDNDIHYELITEAQFNQRYFQQAPAVAAQAPVNNNNVAPSADVQEE